VLDDLSGAADALLRPVHRSALLLDQEHQELRRFCIAGVPPNDVDVVSAFIEDLALSIGLVFAIFVESESPARDVEQS
jgi:hypothetical protein